MVNQVKNFKLFFLKRFFRLCCQNFKHKISSRRHNYQSLITLVEFLKKLINSRVSSASLSGNNDNAIK